MTKKSPPKKLAIPKKYFKWIFWQVFFYLAYSEIKHYSMVVWFWIRFIPKSWWYKLLTKMLTRKNEFHKSLDMDAYACLYMTKKQFAKYSKDLAQRRYEAHVRDLYED